MGAIVCDWRSGNDGAVLEQNGNVARAYSGIFERLSAFADARKVDVQTTDCEVSAGHFYSSLKSAESTDVRKSTSKRRIRQYSIFWTNQGDRTVSSPKTIICQRLPPARAARPERCSLPLLRRAMGLICSESSVSLRSVSFSSLSVCSSREAASLSPIKFAKSRPIP